MTNDISDAIVKRKQVKILRTFNQVLTEIDYKHRWRPALLGAKDTLKMIVKSKGTDSVEYADYLDSIDSFMRNIEGN